jgi:hypothetical protein
MKKFLVLALLLLSTLAFAQSEPDFEFEFFPSGLNFFPLKANYEEPRLGIQYLVKTNDLKVDIGNSSDLLSFRFPKINARLTFGVDFFAYALATSYEGHRLQIDALDGFFGGNGSFTRKFENSEIQLRLRIIHNSAHLVDGHYDPEEDDWMNGDEPLPYTRDLGELTAAYLFPFGSALVKIYGSVSYSTLVRPQMEKWLANAGYEFALPSAFGRVLNAPVTPFVTSHFYLDGNPDYTFNSNNMLGVKFGEWRGKGVVFYLDYFNGYHYLSEYFLERVEQFGIGFFVEFN